MLVKLCSIKIYIIKKISQRRNNLRLKAIFLCIQARTGCYNFATIYSKGKPNIETRRSL